MESSLNTLTSPPETHGEGCGCDYCRMRGIETVEVEIPCAECGEPITARFAVGGGLMPGEYTLIADWLFHPACWDEKVERHPTDSGDVEDGQDDPLTGIL